MADTHDPLAAAVAAIRERGYRKRAGSQCARLSDAAAGDVPQLLAAVEAALALADEWAATPFPDYGGDRTGIAVEQGVLDAISLRSAISAALLGQGEAKDGTDGR